MNRDHPPIFYAVRGVVRFTFQALLAGAFFMSPLIPQLLGADFS